VRTPLASPSCQPLRKLCLWCILEVAVRRFAAPADRQKRNRRSSDTLGDYPPSRSRSSSCFVIRQYSCVASITAIHPRSKIGCQNGAELAMVDGSYTLSPAMQGYSCVASITAIHPRSKIGCQNGAELAMVDGSYTLSPAMQGYSCATSNTSIDPRSKRGCQNGAELAMVDLLGQLTTPWVLPG